MVTEKRKWIWFRGLVRWKVHWGDFPDNFKKVFPNDEVICLDFPGFGERFQEASPSNMEDLLDYIESRIDWEKGPYHLLAFSLGGMVGAQLASRRPQSFQKIFLVNTSDQRSPSVDRFHPRNYWLLASCLAYPEARFVESGILDLISNFPDTQKKYRARFIDAFNKNPFSRSNFFRQLKIANQAHFPEKAPVSAVFLCSKGDRLVSHRCSERIASDWGAPLEVHQQAGHDLTLDDPEWVLEKLQSHL